MHSLRAVIALLLLALHLASLTINIGIWPHQFQIGLGIWIGDGVKDARVWLQAFAGLKNRGPEDVFITVRNGLKVLPEATNTTWEHTVVQQCTVHLIRNNFRYASPTAPGRERDLPQTGVYGPVRCCGKGSFDAEWDERYTAIVHLWHGSWAEATATAA